MTQESPLRGLVPVFVVATPLPEHNKTRVVFTSSTGESVTIVLARDVESDLYRQLHAIRSARIEAAIDDADEARAALIRDRQMAQVDAKVLPEATCEGCGRAGEPVGMADLCVPCSAAIDLLGHTAFFALSPLARRGAGLGATQARDL